MPQTVQAHLFFNPRLGQCPLKNLPDSGNAVFAAIYPLKQPGLRVVLPVVFTRKEQRLFRQKGHSVLLALTITDDYALSLVIDVGWLQVENFAAPQSCRID